MTGDCPANTNLANWFKRLVQLLRKFQVLFLQTSPPPVSVSSLLPTSYTSPEKEKLGRWVGEQVYPPRFQVCFRRTANSHTSTRFPFLPYYEIRSTSYSTLLCINSLTPVGERKNFSLTSNLPSLSQNKTSKSCSILLLILETDEGLESTPKSHKS